jgi:hypothetical protein
MSPIHLAKSRGLVQVSIEETKLEANSKNNSPSKSNNESVGKGGESGKSGKGGKGGRRNRGMGKDVTKRRRHRQSAMVVPDTLGPGVERLKYARGTIKDGKILRSKRQSHVDIAKRSKRRGKERRLSVMKPTSDLRGVDL